MNDPVKMESNSDLYAFLADLSIQLSTVDSGELSATLDYAKGFASGSPTEFLGESRIALKSLYALKALSDNQRKQVEFVLRKIDEAFVRVGGV